MKKIIMTLILTILSQKVYAGFPQLLIVGDGCAFATIGDAIDAAAPAGDEIRITNTHNYNENIIIDKSLIIKGGYASCENAQSDTLGETKTTIDAQNLGNTLYVDTNGIVLKVSNLILTNGSYNGVSPVDAHGGAVSLLGENLDITFSNTSIKNSIGLSGGGIYINSDGSVITLERTLINVNQAHLGGGIYCSNETDISTTAINIDLQSGIFNNEAISFKGGGGLGGGLYTNNCISNLRSGEGGIDLLSHRVGISANTAARSGGGIYAINDSHILSPNSGTDARPINIDNNIANTDFIFDNSGGGIYLSDSSLEVHNLFINRNKISKGNGGGIYLDNSVLISNPAVDLVSSCIQNGYSECNLFSNNSATDVDGVEFSGFGGAIYMTNNSTMFNADQSIKSHFENNRANFASVAGVIEGSTLSFHNSYFINNGSTGPIVATDDLAVFYAGGDVSEINVNFSTIANNFNDTVFAIADTSTINVFGSIVYESDMGGNQVLVFGVADGPIFDFGCTIFYENDSIGPIPILGGSIVSQDPGFISEETGNYHLRYDSIAIDRCGDNGLNNIGLDRDNDERGTDFPILNGGPQGNFDAGADETKADDLIFADGFEE